MSKTKPASVTGESRTTPEAQPEVVVDFRFEQGLLHVAVANVSGVSAHNVSVKFDKPFRGLGGEQETSSLPMFRRLLFLAPYKTIETFVDSSSAYFARREPTRIAATISYRDSRRRLHERHMTHDLGIYKEITYVVKAADGGASASRTSSAGSVAPGAREQRDGSPKR